MENTPKTIYTSTRGAINSVGEIIKSALGYGSTVTISLPPPPPIVTRLDTTAEKLAEMKAWAAGNRTRIAACVLGIGVAAFVLRAAHMKKHRRRSVEAGREVVVLTGADTAIGRSIALHLEQKGFIVFAAVSSTHQAEALVSEGREGLRTLVVDLNKPNSVAQAVGQVSAFLETSPLLSLAAIVNAASMTVYGPFEAIPYEQWMRIFEVNVLGPVLVTQGFLPLLRQYRHRNPRIVLLSSSATKGSFGLPFTSAASASRQALDALSDSLRREVARFGVQVVCLQPEVGVEGLVDPNGGGALGEAEGVDVAKENKEEAKREIETTISSWPAHLQRLYSFPYRITMLTSLSSQPSRSANRSFTLPEAAYDALTLNRPPSNIRVGNKTWVYPLTGEWMPEAWVDRTAEEKGHRWGGGKKGVEVMEDVDDGFERVEVRD